MRILIKKAVMWAYARGLLSLQTCQRVFDVLRLGRF